ncbi:MAG: cytosine deaminase [Alphaproteobacteria bacterium]|nr:cytosine deaminase [Alphaproteobacteria bacterium]
MTHGPDLLIANTRVPACLLEDRDDEGGDITVDIEIRDGKIAAISPPGTTAKSSPSAPPTPPGSMPKSRLPTLSAGMVWPGFVDLHTHLDKGHIWPRAENPDGTFAGAIDAVRADRRANWSADDVRRRFDFGLRCAYAHGTVAIRTHLDCEPPQHRISLPVFQELRDAWAGRIALQAVSLLPIDRMDEPLSTEIADQVADVGGVLGAVTFMVPDLAARLDRVFRLAAERGLDLDFHVDETDDPMATSLREIALAALRNRFTGKIVSGHCCSLARQPPRAVALTLGLVREAGIAVVSLPMCNLYLQDRVPGRTPRWRGVTLLHELAAQNTPVALASDNCRDPFYAFGDHDMLEVFREAVRIGHLDRPLGSWPRAVTATPADIMGLENHGRIAVGAPADLVLFGARNANELLSRPQSDRIVLRAGRPIDRRLPDYQELDGQRST